jgi:diguanylate cyclase (GGDEF)-like protein/PAS domain S-box-containing protein
MLVLDPAGRIVRFNPYLEKLSGYRLAEVQGKDWFRTFLPERDQERIRRLFWTAIGQIQTCGNINAIVTKDGSEREIEWYDKTLRDAQGKVVALLATGQDITDRRRAEAALRESEARYRTLIENQGEGVGFVDPDERFTFANPAAESLLGVPPGSLTGRNLAEFVNPAQFAAIREQTTFRRAGGKSSYEIEVIQPNGKKRLVLVTATPKFDDAGQFSGAFGIFRDITDRKQAEEKLKYLIAHDPLTGLYNRGFLEEAMTRLERGQGFPNTIVMVDIDFLKQTNDHEGHAAGDALLRRTAQVLTAAFRSEDVVARIGGDEFAVLMPSTDAVTAEQLLTRFRENLHHHNVTHGGTWLSVSLGAFTAGKGFPLGQALAQADTLMYRQKHCAHV